MKALTAEEAARRKGLVDELGGIQERLAKVKLDVAREKTIKEEMRDIWMHGVGAAGRQVFHGDLFTAEVSARKIERFVDVCKLFLRIGAKRFLPLVSVTLKNLETLPAADQAGMISSDQTGSREITVMRALKPAAARKAA